MSQFQRFYADLHRSIGFKPLTPGTHAALGSEVTDDTGRPLHPVDLGVFEIVWRCEQHRELNPNIQLSLTTSGSTTLSG